MFGEPPLVAVEGDDRLVHADADDAVRGVGLRATGEQVVGHRGVRVASPAARTLTLVMMCVPPGFFMTPRHELA